VAVAVVQQQPQHLAMGDQEAFPVAVAVAAERQLILEQRARAAQGAMALSS